MKMVCRHANASKRKQLRAAGEALVFERDELTIWGFYTVLRKYLKQENPASAFVWLQR